MHPRRVASLTIVLVSHCSTPNSADVPHWPQYTHDNSTYIELSDVTGAVRTHVNATFRDRYCALWDDVNYEHMRVP